ncbi:hypothetical protein [Streptomyces alboflavus]|uniref:hypothetical protein n=1 Tax=Streptomyces alboflavus TaxID=67267 RepID=UPI0037A4A96F
MRRVLRTALSAAGALALAAGALAATTGQAAAAPRPIGQCTTRSGAVLAVDFSDWGGPILRSCGTTPTTGYELLNQGGWRTTGTGHDGPAFICRIGYSGYKGGKQFPTPAQDDCVLTPPATAYWSYWHADPGENTWEYSQLGAMLYKPKPGSVDLWIFGGTNIEGTKGRPTVSPNQLRARNSRPVGGKAPAPHQTKTAKPLPPGVDTGPAPERPVTEKPAPKPKKDKKGEKGGKGEKEGKAKPKPKESPSPSATKKSSPSAGSGDAKAAPGPSTKVVDAAPAADADHDAGSYVPAALTGALVLLVGGAGAYAAKRRRRTE